MDVSRSRKISIASFPCKILTETITQRPNINPTWIFFSDKSKVAEKLPQIQTKFQGLKVKDAQVVNDLNRFTRGYNEGNGTTTSFDNEHASDGKNAHIKLAYRAIVVQEKELKIFSYAYAQAGKTLDDMAIEVENEQGRTR